MNLKKELRLCKFIADPPVRKNTQSKDIKMKDLSNTANSLAHTVTCFYGYILDEFLLDKIRIFIFSRQWYREGDQELLLK